MASPEPAAATPKVLVPIADGSEEMEAVIIIDTLRRAEIDVCVASVEAHTLITASRGVRIEADVGISECRGPYDLIALPGGMPGAQRLHDCEPLAALLRDQKAAGRRFAAICAAPAIVLQAQGLLEGTTATCHPGFVDKLEDQSCAGDRVVVDGMCTTSRGPGTAFDFALELIVQLCGPAKAKAVADPMVLPAASMDALPP